VAATDQHEHPADEHSAELQTRDGHAEAAHHARDPHAEPSAQWGWHGTFPKATNIAGWFTVIALFAMLIGNHTSRIEDVYLIGLGTLLAVMLIGGQLARVRARRR
jgi:hypothetical protein